MNLKPIAVQYRRRGRIGWEYFPAGDIPDERAARMWVIAEYGITGKDILQTVIVNNYAELVEKYGGRK